MSSIIFKLDDNDNSSIGAASILASNTIKRFGGMNELERTLEMLFKSGGYIDMRTRMDLLWRTMMMLRSQDRLNATFPDLFIVDAIGESQLRDSFGQ